MTEPQVRGTDNPPSTRPGQALHKGEMFNLTIEEDRRRLAVAIEEAARAEGRREAAQAQGAAPRPLQTDPIQEIVDAAFPTGGTEGPNAWTEERIRVRSRFAEQVERILAEAAQAQGATPRAEELNAANEWEAGYQACYERMQDEGRLLPAAGRTAPSAPQALDAQRLRKAIENVDNSDPLDFLDEGDVIDAYAAEYARLAPSEPTETGETDG